MSPQEVAGIIDAVKKGLNLSNNDFEKYLRNNSTNLADFTKQMEQRYLLKKLFERVKQKGLEQKAWLNELNARANVEMLR
jgi:hypothetical protein